MIVLIWLFLCTSACYGCTYVCWCVWLLELIELGVEPSALSLGIVFKPPARRNPVDNGTIAFHFALILLMIFSSMGGCH
jgi:hypothetical protein